MEFDSVGLVITDYCNARCEMCCAGREEIACHRHTLSPEELNCVLAQIKVVPQITSIGITGGEPMLFEDQVRQILDYDYGRPMQFSLKTNGSWGSSPREAKTFLAEYSDRLKKISFSYDGFHRKYVDVSSIRTLIDLAWDYEIPTDVVGCFLHSGTSAGEILDALGEQAYKCTFFYQPVIRTGLAKDLPESDFIKPYGIGSPLPCCAPLRHTLLVNTSLDVYPCCSQVIEGTILKAGNLNSDTLSHVIESIAHNRLLVALFTEGVGPFLQMAYKGEADGLDGLPFSSPCEACEYVFRDARFLERIRHEMSDIIAA